MPLVVLEGPYLPGRRREMKRLEPRVAAALTEAETLAGEDGRLAGLHAAGLPAFDLEGADVSGCVFERCRFSDCRAGHAAFTDVVFRACDLSGMDASGAGFVRCVFEDCKGLGLRAMDGYFHHALIQGGRFEAANLDGAVCKALELRGVSLARASFAGCRLEGFAPNDADLTGVSFFGAKLCGVDFRHAQIDGLACAGPELKGAVVTAYQASKLAKLLGLIVKEEA